MSRLGFSPLARYDLAEIALYIAEDCPERALPFIAELEARAVEASERPQTFAARDDLSPGLRAARHGNYLLFFREVEHGIRIVRIVHGARDLPRMFG